ncbi:HNH endonuclease [Octadecabacter sp. R77987]|uniref:HNH endonuclease n=1 Tax=Octadecabacter sp. R77987 TaxID=3093874 RepID=UPI0036734AE2
MSVAVFSTMICIWCKSDHTTLSKEHAIPEALGCPPQLILDDVACKTCNNSFGKVDHALVKQFEIISVMLGVRRKGKRPPTIDSWSAISSEHCADGPHIYINRGPGDIAANGKKLRPARRSNGIEDAWIKPEDSKMGFSQQFGNDPLFLPSLYKIGLNLVAYNFGAETAASPQYDHVRAFVRSEKGASFLKVAMDAVPTQTATNRVSGPITKNGRAYPMFQVTLLGVTFLLDMAPDQPCLRDLRGAATMMGEKLYVFPAPKA